MEARPAYRLITSGPDVAVQRVDLAGKRQGANGKAGARPAAAVAYRELSLIKVVIGAPISPEGATGSQKRSQRAQAPSDSARPTQSVLAGEGLPLRLIQTRTEARDTAKS